MVDGEMRDEIVDGRERDGLNEIIEISYHLIIHIINQPSLSSYFLK